MADLHALQRGDDLQHGVAEVTRLLREVGGRLGAEPAEENARAVLIGPDPAGRVAVLDHGAHARRDVLDAILGQRFGRDHEGVDRHPTRRRSHWAALGV